MRRAHRSTHVLFWALILPATLIALAVALSARKGDPYTELPAAIAEEAP
jgi:hypothetical protein